MKYEYFYLLKWDEFIFPTVQIRVLYCFLIYLFIYPINCHCIQNLSNIWNSNSSQLQQVVAHSPYSNSSDSFESSHSQYRIKFTMIITHLKTCSGIVWEK